MYKVVFFGSSEYSVAILDTLLKLPGYQLVGVVTKPDKPVGRNQAITPNPVSAFAKSNNLPLFQPELFTDDFKQVFRQLDPDLGLCVAYGPPFFDQEMIDIPKFKIVNIHPSPLPLYRGATPGPWQIINGEIASAVTFFQIDSLPDHGPIISQIPFDITPDETAATFYAKSFKIASQNLSDVLNNYLENPDNLTHQDHTKKTYYPKLSKDRALIDWSLDDIKIYRFIRGLYPWPVAWTFVRNIHDIQLVMKIFSAEYNGKLILKTVQVEGKNKTNWSEIEKHYRIVR